MFVDLLRQVVTLVPCCLFPAAFLAFLNKFVFLLLSPSFSLLLFI